jgi:integrase
MANAVLRLVTPTTVLRTVTPRRRPNSELRAREYLTEAEVERLIEAVKVNRNPHRDATMILIGFRHGLRVAELCDLRWDQVDFESAHLHVRRRKNGTPSVHPISGRELRALRKLQREAQRPFLFVSERGAPFAVAGFQRLIQRAGEAAGFEFKVHPHMLRHSTGYYLANNGHDTRAIQSYLGHRNIQHTVVYTALSSDRFRRFWKD